MRIFIGSLSYQATEEDIYEAFEQGGCPVTQVKIITDRDTGKSKGFAFAECESPDVLQQMNEQDICGRNVLVNEARPKADGAARGRR